MSTAPIPVKIVPRTFLYPFILVTTLFALWGFANDVTNPLVRVFKEVFIISNAQSSLVQWAFYGGYATMAIPAALVIRKFSYKTGIVIGLALYAAGALLTIPASRMLSFNTYLRARARRCGLARLLGARPALLLRGGGRAPADG